MKLLVFGANSQLGLELTALLAKSGIDHATLATDEVDILNAKEVVKAVSRINPTQLINVSTYGNLQKAEGDAAAAKRCDLVNTDGVTALARVCEQLAIPMLHHSSSYVFDGQKKDTYLEDDETNPTCRYGRSKWYGERSLREETERHIILRTDWLFSLHRDFYFRDLVSTCKKQKGKLGVVDNRFSPTFAGDAARVILAIVKQVDCNAQAWGTYHYNAMQPVNQDQFVQMVLEECAKHDPALAKVMPDLKIEPLPVEAPYIRNSALNCEKLLYNFGIKQRSRGPGTIQVLEAIYGVKPKAKAPEKKPVAKADTDMPPEPIPAPAMTRARPATPPKAAKAPKRQKRPARKAATRKASPSP